MHNEPNLVIFRIKSDDSNKQFTELTFFDKKLSVSGDIFTTNETDSYQDLHYHEVVLARLAINGFIELGRFSIEENKILQNIHSLKHDELEALTCHLCLSL